MDEAPVETWFTYTPRVVCLTVESLGRDEFVGILQRTLSIALGLDGLCYACWASHTGNIDVVCSCFVARFARAWSH